MEIYFSCSITGGRQDQAIYERMVDFLDSKGHQVLTAHLSRADVLEAETAADAAQVYERDVDWVRQCAALVAEVSTPSHGVGYEIALALQLNKPVLCCYRKGCRVSKMILGNPHPSLSLCAYESAADLDRQLAVFLAQLEMGG